MQTLQQQFLYAIKNALANAVIDIEKAGKELMLKSTSVDSFDSHTAARIMRDEFARLATNTNTIYEVQFGQRNNQT